MQRGAVKISLRGVLVRFRPYRRMRACHTAATVRDRRFPARVSGEAGSPAAVGSLPARGRAPQAATRRAGLEGMCEEGSHSRVCGLWASPRGRRPRGGSRRAADGGRENPSRRRRTVEYRGRRSGPARAADLAFLTRLHSSQRRDVPRRTARSRSRTEEARGSNPLTSTPILAGQSVASLERATLAACCGRAAAANSSRQSSREGSQTPDDSVPGLYDDRRE
jgi:hypothetical protein